MEPECNEISMTKEGSFSLKQNWAFRCSCEQLSNTGYTSLLVKHREVCKKRRGFVRILARI